MLRNSFVGAALALAAATSLSACAEDGPGADTATGVAPVELAVGTRPAFQAPFPCGTAIRMESFGHAPALDIFRNPTSATEGAQLVAPAAGVVKLSYMTAPTSAGNVIQIDHGGGWFTTYLHLQSRSVSAGQHVDAGDPIGKVGHTGATSNGVSHVHFEMAIDRNGDGLAEWGYPNDERVPPVFNGVTYGTGNSQTSYVTSNNCSGTTPPPTSSCTGPNGWPGPLSHIALWQNAPGRSGSSTSCPQVGSSKTATNPQYIYCRRWGGEVRDGNGNFNHWWLWTDLDTGGRGWISAYYISGQGNDQANDMNTGHPIPDCT